MNDAVYKIYHGDELVCSIIQHGDMMWEAIDGKGAIMARKSDLEDLWYFVAGYMTGAPREDRRQR